MVTPVTQTLNHGFPRARLFFVLALFLALRVDARPAAQRTLTGFTLNFDFFNNWQEARRLLRIARASGAEILNVVPPPYVGENQTDIRILKNIFRLTRKWGIKVLLSRIDASHTSPVPDQRNSFFYDHILDRPGRLPSGKPTPDFFRETVGNRVFTRWQLEETEYYAKHFSGEKNLLGFSIGLFNEPFVSERGSLLCYDFASDSYEIAQYTPSCQLWWRGWLQEKYANDLTKVNQRYGTAFVDFSDIPMPKNECDSRFGRPPLAYWDFASSINDWVIRQYRECRAVWRRFAKRPIPFIWQFSGFVPEKLAIGRPAFAALDIFAWMQMADALGLSLYTYGAYPDWGHASAQAMIHFLRLASLQKKPIFVMEGGNENDGAVLQATELDFFAGAARMLKPRAQIYEFFGTSYADEFAHQDGNIVSPSGEVRSDTLAAVRGALKKAQQRIAPVGMTYVLDDPSSLALENGDLTIQRRLLALALEKTLVFIPRDSLLLLPADSLLLVVHSESIPAVLKLVAGRRIHVTAAIDWLQTVGEAE